MHQGPEELASIAKLEMSGKTSERESHSKRSAAAVDIAENDSEERARTMKQTVISNNPWKIKADSSVSDFFVGTATPHNSNVDSIFFMKMIQDIQTAGPALVVPNFFLTETSIFYFCCG